MKGVAGMSESSFGKRFFKQFILTLLIQIVSAAVVLVLCHLNSVNKIPTDSFWILGMLIFSDYKIIFIAGCVTAVVVNIVLTLKYTFESGKRIIMEWLMPTNFTYPVLFLLSLWLTAHKFVEFIGMLAQKPQ